MKRSNHKYLIALYSRTDEVLSGENIKDEEIPDLIISFCTVVEKILKIKLYNKNPLLIFEGIKEDNMLSAIVLKKEDNIETVKIKTIIARFGIIFKRTFTPDELQTIFDIYNVRNCFIHGYKPDDKVIFDAEDLIKRMGTVWEKISVIAVQLFGKENIKKAKPKKKYTEKELEEVLEDEVRKMIKAPQSRYPFSALRVTPSYAGLYSSPFSSLNECPRCGSYSFSSPENKTDWLAPAYTLNNLQWESGSNLYKCKECNLELTEKQYEIAKKILTEKSRRLPI